MCQVKGIGRRKKCAPPPVIEREGIGHTRVEDITGIIGYPATGRHVAKEAMRMYANMFVTPCLAHSVPWPCGCRDGFLTAHELEPVFYVLHPTEADFARMQVCDTEMP